MSQIQSSRTIFIMKFETSDVALDQPMRVLKKLFFNITI